MAVSDANMIIRFFDMGYTPKTHDSTAWNGTSFGKWINDGNLPSEFFLLGDSAFRPGSTSLITPGTKNGTTTDYKYVQSRARMPVEQAFGVLMRTWGILWRPLEIDFYLRAPLMCALIHLHNLRMTRNSDSDGMHQTRFKRVNGEKIEEWGLPVTKRNKSGDIITETEWYDAPVLADDPDKGRVRKGLLRSRGGETFTDDPDAGGGTVSAKDVPHTPQSVQERMQSIQRDIELRGVARPAGSKHK